MLSIFVSMILGVVGIPKRWGCGKLGNHIREWIWSGDLFKCLNVIDKSTYIEGIGQKHRTRKRAKHTICGHLSLQCHLFEVLGPLPTAATTVVAMSVVVRITTDHNHMASHGDVTVTVCQLCCLRVWMSLVAFCGDCHKLRLSPGQPHLHRVWKHSQRRLQLVLVRAVSKIKTSCPPVVAGSLARSDSFLSCWWFPQANGPGMQHVHHYVMLFMYFHAPSDQTSQSEDRFGWSHCIERDSCCGWNNDLSSELEHRKPDVSGYSM